MAGNVNTEYVYFWYIENYSYCWHKNEESLFSPVFVADGLESTAWFLKLDGRGGREESKGFISLFLCRDTDDYPEEFELKFELSILAADGSALLSTEFEYIFGKQDDGYGCDFVRMDELWLRKKEYLSQDTLRIRCKIWRVKENIQTVTQIYARTRFEVQLVSFLHVVENFSEIELNKKKTVKIRYPIEKESAASSSVYLTDGACCERKIMVEITPPNARQILSKCQLSLLDASGTAVECGKVDNRLGATTQSICKLPLSLSSKDILNRKTKYLPDGKLSILCECVFSTGLEYNSIEKILHEIPSVTLNQVMSDGANNRSAADEDFPSALDDLKDIYDDQFLTDFELKTKTKSFPAHKIVLCARSPVFKAMLSNDMKEKITDCIQIDDMDDDIVQKLLLFLYSDQLVDLDWETATALYYASDKYGIEKLKALCTTFLKDNLSNLTAPELLLLADSHNDYKLKEAVEDFILMNENEVFCSDEWEKLIETNSQLVIKTMQLKYKRNKLELFPCVVSEIPNDIQESFLLSDESI